jgi:hypothetical protein
MSRRMPPFCYESIVVRSIATPARAPCDYREWLHVPFNSFLLSLTGMANLVRTDFASKILSEKENSSVLA